MLDSTRGLRLRLVRFRLIAIFTILRSLKRKDLWSLKFMRPYLSRNLTLAQRIGCAITHYSFEGRNYGPIYHRSVHQSAGGLVLWHQVVDGTRYTIALRATEDTRREGDLSVSCFVNDTRVCRLCFSYVNASLFGLRPGRTMFVTRSQTDRNSELQCFRDTFKQNSPPYFCLAAVCGIAMANGMRAIFMIKPDAQLGYAERYAEGFRNSYSELWEAFGAQELDQLHAYTMSLPLKLNPLSCVKHKGRAIARRRNWLEVALSARRAMLEDRTSSDPAPIEGEAYALLPHLANVQAEDQGCESRSGALRDSGTGTPKKCGGEIQRGALIKGTREAMAKHNSRLGCREAASRHSQLGLQLYSGRKCFDDPLRPSNRLFLLTMPNKRLMLATMVCARLIVAH